MATSTGQCPQCRAVNSYSAINCIECGKRLPWGDVAEKSASASNIDLSQPLLPPTTTPPPVPVVQTQTDSGLTSGQKFYAFAQQFYSCNGCIVTLGTFFGTGFMLLVLCITAGFPAWMFIFLPPIFVIGVWAFILAKAME